jgi:hypothetical protein
MTELRNVTNAVARQAHRARRSAGRIVVSAAGFSVAYYLDPENGAQRRHRLHELMRKTGATIDGAITPGMAPTSTSAQRPIPEPALHAVPFAASSGAGAAH